MNTYINTQQSISPRPAERVGFRTEPSAHLRTRPTTRLLPAAFGSAVALLCLVWAGPVAAAPEDDLFAAIVRNQKANVEKALGAGASIEALNKDGDTPLVVAASYDRTAIVELLIQKGAGISSRGKDQDTALHRAAKHSKSTTLELLLAKGAGPNEKNEKGDTPLFVAVAADRTAHIAPLLSRGVSAEFRNAAGDTALLAAVRAKRYYSTQALVAAGASRSAVDAKGHTPVRLALDLWVTSIINLLLVPGTDVDVPDTEGNTCLHVVASWTTTSYVQKVADLSRKVDARNAAGETPLVIAVRRYRHANVELLAKRGAEVNVKMPDGTPVLAFAVSYGLTYVVRALRTGKLVVDVPVSGEPAIVDAAVKNRAAIVSELIGAGASPNTKTKNGVPVLLAAYAGSRWDSVTTLVKAGADLAARDHNGETALLLAARLGHPGNVQLLLQNGADPNVRNKHGDPVLVAAGDGGNTTVLARLLEKITDVNQRGAQGDTALMRAAAEGHDGAVSLLLSKGANANLTNERGESALSLALFKGRESVFRLLVRGGADVRTKDAQGNTLLLVAARTEPGSATRPMLRMMEELLKAGLKADEPNRHGNTALSVAMSRRNLSTLELLLKSGVDLSARTKYGHTLFHQTILSGLHGDAPPHLDTGPESTRDLAYLLFAGGALVETADRNGRTPLLHCVRDAGERNTDRAAACVQLLLDLGAALDARDRAGKTPWDYSQQAPKEVQTIVSAHMNSAASQDDFDPIVLTGREDDDVASFSQNLEGTAHVVVREGSATSLVQLDRSGRVKTKTAMAGLAFALTESDGSALTASVLPGSGDKTCKPGEDLQFVLRRESATEPKPEYRLSVARSCAGLVVRHMAFTKDRVVVAVRFSARDERLLFLDAELKLKSSVSQTGWNTLSAFGEDGVYLRGDYTYYYKAGRRQWARRTTNATAAATAAYADGDIVSVESGPKGTLVVDRRNNWFTAKWRRIYAGAPMQPVAVSLDAQGNAYVAGTVEGALHGNRAGAGTDVFIMKIDAQGQRLWTRQFGTTGNDTVRAVFAFEGAVFVSGNLGGSLDGRAAGAGRDGFLVKFSTDGKRSRRRAGLFGG